MRRRNPVGRKVARKDSAGRKSFAVRIPGVNISISMQPTRKGIMIVKPRVSRVTITRAGENPRRRRNPLPMITTPGRIGLTRPGILTRRFS